MRPAEGAGPTWQSGTAPDSTARNHDSNSTDTASVVGTHGRYAAPLHRLMESANLRESQALDCLRDAITAIGLTPGQAVAIFSAASSYAKASAARMLAERGVRQ